MIRNFDLEEAMADESVCNVSVKDLIDEFKRPIYLEYLPENIRDEVAKYDVNQSSTSLCLIDTLAFAAMCVLRRKNGLREPIGV